MVEYNIYGGTEYHFWVKDTKRIKAHSSRFRMQQLESSCEAQAFKKTARNTRVIEILLCSSFTV